MNRRARIVLAFAPIACVIAGLAAAPARSAGEAFAGIAIEQPAEREAPAAPRAPQPAPPQPAPLPPRDAPGAAPPGRTSTPPPGSPASSRDPAIPAITGPVVDTADILGANDERLLERLAYELRQKTSAEMAVLTVRTTAPLDDFEYGMRVVKAWQLGSAKTDDGLLLLVAVDDRRARFFTGYGLEGVLPDGRLGAILDRFVIPGFRAGDFPAGIRAGMTEIARILTSEYDGEAWPEYRPRRSPGGGLLPLLILALFIAMSMSGRRRRRYHPIFWGGGGFGGPFRGGFGGGFGGGGGGFGGGFGGGGGGFGGGGAGRSW